MSNEAMITAEAAAAELGVTLATLYAYVSRGLIRSEVGDAGRRTRRYQASDVRKLKERQELRRDPKKVVDTALEWGVPLRESALTLIESGRCYYRGRDAADLAQNLTVEQTAAWIWLEDMSQADALFSSTVELPQDWNALSLSLAGAAPIERFQRALPQMGANDLAAYDFRPRHVAGAGARILQLMTALAVAPSAVSPGSGIAESLQRTWTPDQPEAAALFRAALILCADHELNVSSFTARCVASAGASPYDVVCAGLAALKGIKHGGNCARVEALFREAAGPNQVRQVVAERVRRGDPVPGFGHLLYPEGDPRGRALIELSAALRPEAPGVRLALALAAEAHASLHEEPNLDFGLCTLCAALGLPQGTPLTLFALGRTLGWIGHAIEEYQADALIRPRARYTGRLPIGRQ